MEEVIIWPEALNWHEIGRVFLIMSIIALCVSYILHKYLKGLPVFAAQLSILSTLAIYPMINFYTLIASEYEVFDSTGRANPSNYGALVFLAPLPACILIAAIFFIFRNRKTEKKTSLQPNKTKLVLKLVPGILSLTIGSVWLSVSMLFERDEFPTTVAMFMVYTILGFLMYLATEFVLLIVKKSITGSDEDNRTS